MKPPSTLRLLPAPTQMHLCRLIRFVLLTKPFAPLPRLYFSLSFCSPSPSSRLTPLLSDSQFLSSCVCFPSPPITFSPGHPRPLQLGIHASSSADRQLMYGEAKMAARPYQTAKQQWFRSLQEMGLGTWVKKPPEQEQFLLSD